MDTFWTDHAFHNLFPFTTLEKKYCTVYYALILIHTIYVILRIVTILKGGLHALNLDEPIAAHYTFTE
jgi:uncharacterized membrane protein